MRASIPRSESVADRALRDGSTFANIEHATTWTRESLKNLLAVVCIVAAKVLPESDVSVLLDEASDLMDEPAEPYDADQAKQDWLAERAAEDYYDKRDRA